MNALVKADQEMLTLSSQMFDPAATSRASGGMFEQFLYLGGEVLGRRIVWY